MRGLLLLVALGTVDLHAAEITSRMLVEMREITSVSPSPDNSRVVIGMAQPNVSTNRRDVSWVIVPLKGNSPRVTLPGGEEISDPKAPGALLNVAAVWRPDGRSFFYLRCESGEVQLWETDASGKNSRKVTHSAADIIDVHSSGDVWELELELAPDRDGLLRAEEKEDHAGVLYDDHVLTLFPFQAKFPIIDRWRSLRRADDGKWLPRGWYTTRTATFNIRTGAMSVKEGGKDVTASCGADCAENAVYRVNVIATEAPAKQHPEDYGGKYTLQLTARKGAPEPAPAPRLCLLSECHANGITILGWSDSGDEIFYIANTRDGHLVDRAPHRSVVYAWNPARDRVRLVHDGNDFLYTRLDASGSRATSEAMRGDQIIVATSREDEPPQLVKIDLETGQTQSLFDPNAGLRALTRNRTRWITWPTPNGYQGRGVLILPDAYQPERKYPLVVTSYVCGPQLLHGGGSDNAPEFVLAHLGFISVCLDLPMDEMTWRESGWSTLYPIACHIVSALIDDQTRHGSVDGGRVGLSGHSFGSDLGAYCLAHESGKNSVHPIAAAAFRSGSVTERSFFQLFETPRWRRDLYVGPESKMGLPDPANDPAGRWRAQSVAENVESIGTPLLMQDDDLEYLMSLPLWSALHSAGKPVEMYIFPNELHRLMQPIHQLVNFERQIDWFRFWLQNYEDPAPSKAAQYQRWRQLRDRRHS